MNYDKIIVLHEELSEENMRALLELCIIFKFIKFFLIEKYVYMNFVIF